MIRIWLTDYDIDPITGWGSKCGPDIQAPALMIAESEVKRLRKKDPKYRDLRILGYLVCTIPTTDGTPFTPDFENMVDLDKIWMN